MGDLIDWDKAQQSERVRDFKRQRGRLKREQQKEEELAQQLLTLDFHGITPATGGRQTDLVPDGQYRLKITKAEVNTAAGQSKEQTAIIYNYEVQGGDYDGSRLRDTFTLPRPGTDDSDFGQQKLAALFLALGTAVAEKVVRNFDADVLVGKEFYCETVQKTLPPRENAPANAKPAVVCNIDVYVPLEVVQAGQAAAATRTNGRAAAPAAAAPAAAPAPAAPAAAVALEEDDEEDEGITIGDEAAPAAEDEVSFDAAAAPVVPVQPVPPRRRAAAAAPTPAAAAVSNEVDALF